MAGESRSIFDSNYFWRSRRVTIIKSEIVLASGRRRRGGLIDGKGRRPGGGRVQRVRESQLSPWTYHRLDGGGAWAGCRRARQRRCRGQVLAERSGGGWRSPAGAVALGGACRPVWRTTRRRVCRPARRFQAEGGGQRRQGRALRGGRGQGRVWAAAACESSVTVGSGTRDQAAGVFFM
jgi:hypothetical protein